MSIIHNTFDECFVVVRKTKCRIRRNSTAIERSRKECRYLFGHGWQHRLWIQTNNEGNLIRNINVTLDEGRDRPWLTSKIACLCSTHGIPQLYPSFQFRQLQDWYGIEWTACLPDRERTVKTLVFLLPRMTVGRLLLSTATKEFQRHLRWPSSQTLTRFPWTIWRLLYIRSTIISVAASVIRPHQKTVYPIKESTILEEDLNDAYLMMKHVEQPPST